jgi:hypothetical protein
MSEGEWNEDKYKMQEELQRSNAHDCIGDRKNCDTIHPNFEKCILGITPLRRPQDKKPPSWRKWMLKPKACIGYYNQHTMRYEAFNVSQAFDQMSTNGKLNVLNTIIYTCLDDNERSLFFTDMQEIYKS